MASPLLPPPRGLPDRDRYLIYTKRSEPLKLRVEDKLTGLTLFWRFRTEQLRETFVRRFRNGESNVPPDGVITTEDADRSSRSPAP